MNAESKIVYKEPNGQIRSLRGEITNADDLFLYLKRRDGEFTIAKNLVLYIERWNGERNERV